MSDKKAFAYFRVGNAEQLSNTTDNRVFLYCRQSYDDSHFMNQQQEHLLRHCTDKGYQAAGSTAVVASAKDEKENMLRLAERLKAEDIKTMLISDPSHTSAKNPIRRYSPKKPIRQCNRSRKSEIPKRIPTAKPTSSKSPSLLNAQTAVSD